MDGAVGDEDFYREMYHRFNIDVTKRRLALRVLKRRNRASLSIDYDALSDDAINFETNLVLAKMRNMTPEEATAFAAQAAAEAEVAMIEAAEAMREAEAAAAEAQAAVAAFKKMKARNTNKVRHLLPSKTSFTCYKLNSKKVNI